MPNKQSLIGRQFGSWNIIADAPPCWDRWKNKSYLRERSVGQCICGRQRIIRNHNLLSGKSLSCGCQRTAWNRTHGMAGTQPYHDWLRMIYKCEKPDHPQYKWYGSRGISVCERWHSFENFLADMGERPRGLTIHRVDNDGNYEPGNCVWANRKTQSRHKRNNRLVTFNGVTASLAEICERFHLNYGAVSHRLLRGWPDEDACSRPLRRVRTRPGRPTDQSR